MSRPKKKKKGAVRNAIDAHGWVGLVISVPLFIVFWAGAITLFYPEVQRWASLPHFPLQASGRSAGLSAAVDEAIARNEFDPSRRLSINLPGEYTPYLRISMPVYDSPDIADKARAERILRRETVNAGGDPKDVVVDDPAPRSRQWRNVLVDPGSGEILTDNSPFKLARFLDRLHYSLMLPQGLYIVGVMTFFFLVIVFTGIVIQFKNMIRNFFLYRHGKALRYKMNDLHNVVGVISLPYGLMYALTGLMFNLGIVFQLPMLLFVFDGDRNALAEAAGFGRASQAVSYVEKPMPDLNVLLAQLESQSNAEILSIRVHNYGDQNALIRFTGLEQGSFDSYIDRIYDHSVDAFPAHLNADDVNAMSDGTSLLFSVHMGTFAGVDLRLIYFLLAMGFCAMIIAGNVLWIAKRNKKQEYPKTLRVTRGLTLGGCVGVVPATALAFLLERVLPLGLEDRDDWVMWGFGLVLLLSVVCAFFNGNYKRFIAHACCFSVVVLAMLVLVDLLWFGTTLAGLWVQGFQQPLAVTASLAMCLVALAYTAFRLLAGERGEETPAMLAAKQQPQHS